MTITAAYLSKLLGITVDAAATLLARACERREIHGQEFQGRNMYEVTDEWINQARLSCTKQKD